MKFIIYELVIPLKHNDSENKSNIIIIVIIDYFFFFWFCFNILVDTFEYDMYIVKMYIREFNRIKLHINYYNYCVFCYWFCNCGKSQLIFWLSLMFIEDCNYYCLNFTFSKERKNSYWKKSVGTKKFSFTISFYLSVCLSFSIHKGILKTI